MTTQTTEQQAQTAGPDWEVDLTITEQWDEDSDLRLTGIDWERALHYDGPDIREQITNPGIYHQRFGGHFLVGISFQFEVDKDGRISALGRLHPAEDHRGDYYTEEWITIMAARIDIKPRTPETAEALRDLIREHHGEPPVD